MHRSLFADPSSHPEGRKLAVIVLNNLGSDGNGSKHFIKHAWSTASLRVCADGGANGLYDILEGEDRDAYLPDVIKGDLDSLRPDVARYYEDRGVNIIQAADQDHNDFEKCVREILHRAGSTAAATTLVAVGAHGGRFDQEMAAFHLLHKYTAHFEHFVLLGNGNLSFLLLPGRTHRICPHPPREGPTCGLLPLGQPAARVTSRGLRWDLRAQPLAFGAFVSSSNALEAREVSVTTDAPLVWTIEVSEPGDEGEA
ncbi:thiamine pyrophosphokinase [Tribonema minus]|uniref:Thiamine pyrophosphokinase n=1 Tax=Tribonema minus TaxID=303371 RepID=A0A835ZF58_9STRA|nr:thiamine pyrophosphokinase [Tribonema minus]